MPDLYIGLMSGTSMDGIDSALVAFYQGRPQLVHAKAMPWPQDMAAALHELARAKTTDIEYLCEIDARAGELFAETVQSLLAESATDAATVKAIGSHGQTLRHRPRHKPSFTLQIGDAARIAEITGITTVADFRHRDIAAGGEGAPLVPAFHVSVFGNANENRAVLNIGGIANLTLLPKDGNKETTGFDTGPGNRLMDDWVRQHKHQPFDNRGTWAASGEVQPRLLSALLSDAYFEREPPKSTGTEDFNLEWAEVRFTELGSLKPEDVQASFAQLTAVTVAQALQRRAPGTQRLLVCGGGTHNEDLMGRIAAELPSMTVESTADHGADPDWIEAMAFAWLAKQTLSGKTGSLPEVTGARGARILGAIHQA